MQISMARTREQYNGMPPRVQTATASRIMFDTNYFGKKFTKSVKSYRNSFVSLNISPKLQNRSTRYVLAVEDNLGDGDRQIGGPNPEDGPFAPAPRAVVGAKFKHNFCISSTVTLNSKLFKTISQMNLFILGLT